MLRSELHTKHITQVLAESFALGNTRAIRSGAVKLRFLGAEGDAGRDRIGDGFELSKMLGNKVGSSL